jgi:hypothetical protein
MSFDPLLLIKINSTSFNVVLGILYQTTFKSLKIGKKKIICCMVLLILLSSSYPQQWIYLVKAKKNKKNVYRKLNC